MPWVILGPYWNRHLGNAFKRRPASIPIKVVKSGRNSLLAGFVMAASFFALTQLPSLRESYVTVFLIYFVIAGLAYVFVIYRLGKDVFAIKLIWAFAVLFQLILLFSSPTLSDDVYRYIWDGHLLNQGVNPYALPVNSPLLDAYDTPLRALVNHDWMASPYLPSIQIVFVIVSRLAHQSVLAFQITAIIINLLTGWMVMSILELVKRPRTYVLVYLWNPLVNIEFAHGAHLDSLMLLLMMAAFWLIVRSSKQIGGTAKQITLYGSILALAAATLTKFLPLLLVPIFFRRWGWRGFALYILLILGVLSSFAYGAGWGLTGPLDGTGIFGATRIYLQYWNYNSGIYHWLEVLFSGYQTPGAVPVEIVGEAPIQLAKAVTTGLLGFAVLTAGWLAWRTERNNLYLLRLSLIPLGAYLLLTPTLHPWYVTLVIPFIPFFLNRKDEHISYQDFIWPGIYFSIAVVFSYTTYLDPENLREHTWVRLMEYIPLYLLLGWAILRYIWKRKNLSSLTI